MLQVIKLKLKLTSSLPKFHTSMEISRMPWKLSTCHQISTGILTGPLWIGTVFPARGDLDRGCLVIWKNFESEPQCPEAIRLLVLINSSKLQNHLDNTTLITNTINYINKALKLFPSDLLILKCAAVLFESIDPTASVKFLHCIKSWRVWQLRCIKQLRSFESNNFCKSVINLAHLLKRAQSLTSDALMKTFIKFNEARLLEEEQIQKAEEFLQGNYHGESEFRFGAFALGCHLLHGRNQLAEAADHFKDVLGQMNKIVKLWNCVAATHLKQKAFTPARKSFERVLQKLTRMTLTP